MKIRNVHNTVIGFGSLSVVPDQVVTLPKGYEYDSSTKKGNGVTKFYLDAGLKNVEASPRVKQKTPSRLYPTRRRKSPPTMSRRQVPMSVTAKPVTKQKKIPQILPKQSAAENLSSK